MTIERKKRSIQAEGFLCRLPAAFDLLQYRLAFYHPRTQYEPIEFTMKFLPTSGNVLCRPQKIWRYERLVLVAVLLTCLVLSLGCVHDTYRYGGGGHAAVLSGPSVSAASLPPNPVLVGSENPRLDRIEAVLQKPRRWIRKLAGRADPNPDSIAKDRAHALELAQEFLAANELHDVNIDLRVYQPRRQWARLRANPNVRPIWKYTGGAVNWLRYTLVPMRVLQADYFDPFTNTLSINSADPHKVLFEAAVAKEFHNHRNLGVGAYAMLQYVPFVPVYQTARASSDALTYSRCHLDGEFDRDLYPLAYSRVGSAAVGEVLSITDISPNAPRLLAPVLRISAAVAGRMLGRSQFLWSQQE